MEYTQEEFIAFDAVRKILSPVVGAHRITRREMKSYMSITLDDAPRMTICRIYTGKKLCIGILNNRKVESKHRLGSVDEISQYAEDLRAVVRHYLQRVYA